MKILLLNPPFLPNFVRCGRWQGATARSGGLDYPKWLAYAGGVLEKSGHRVKILDAIAKKKSFRETIEEAELFKPDIIVVESNFSSLSSDVGMTSKMKYLIENAKTVVVGPPASQFADSILSNPGIDVVARYEYDFTIREIAERLSEGKNLDGLRGIFHKKEGKIVHEENRALSTSDDLNAMPFVSEVYKKHLDIRDYYLSQCLYPEVQIFGGRGCPNHCTFCSWPVTLMGREHRTRSAKNIADEFEWINENLQEVREVFVEDDTFTINRAIVREFCSELRDRKMDMTWSCNARANLDYETMKMMKESGCRLIIVGYESGSEKMLKCMRKGTTLQQMTTFSRDARRARIMIHGDFIIGLIGETKETAEETLKLIKKVRPNLLQVSVATPIPGTEFFEDAKAKGFLLVDDLEESIDAKGFQKCIVSYPTFTKDDIEKHVDRILREYYLSPFYVPVALSNIFRKHGLHELKSMLTSASSFLRYLRREDVHDS